MATYYEQMQELFRQYQGEVGISGPTTLKDVGVWAIRGGLWRPPEGTVLSKFTADMGQALRLEHYTDPQGRRVRTKHSVRLPREEAGEQLIFWDDIRTTSRQHMETSAQQRRQAIVADCHSLKMDVDSFNENRNADNPIQLVFDFRADLAELEAVLV
jgi:hypothetical protein